MCKRNFVKYHFHWRSFQNWESNIVPLSNWVHLRELLRTSCFISHWHLWPLPNIPTCCLKGFFLAAGILSPSCPFLTLTSLQSQVWKFFLLEGSLPLRSLLPYLSDLSSPVMVPYFALTGNIYVARPLLLLCLHHIVWYAVPSRCSNECLPTWLFFLKKYALVVSELSCWTMRKLVLLFKISC